MSVPTHILVCGSRYWHDVGYIDRFIKTLVPSSPVIVNGFAPGADGIADYCANAQGLKTKPYPARWDLHGNAAGPIRNKQMLDSEPISFVCAFTYNLFESRGTMNMVKQSLERNISVLYNPSTMSNMQQVVRINQGHLYICREDNWIRPQR